MHAEQMDPVSGDIWDLYDHTVCYGSEKEKTGSSVPSVGISDRRGGLFLRKRYSGNPSGGRRSRRSCVSSHQQSDKRSVRLWGQHPDHGNRMPDRILGSSVRPDGGIFHGGAVFHVSSDGPSFQQESSISVCSIPGGRIYRRNDYWDLLEHDLKKRPHRAEGMKNFA